MQIAIDQLHKNELNKVKNILTSLNSISKIIFNGPKKNILITYDAAVISNKEIIDALEQKGYRIKDNRL